MKNLFLSVILLLTVSFTFATNDAEIVSTLDVENTIELTNSVELPIAEITETIIIAKGESSPGPCFDLGNAVFDIIGESAESVALVNFLCAWLGLN